MAIEKQEVIIQKIYEQQLKMYEEQQKMYQEQKKMYREQQKMKKDQQEMKKEQQEMKKDQQEMKKEIRQDIQKTNEELRLLTNVVTKIEYEFSDKIKMLFDAYDCNKDKLDEHEERFEKDEKVIDRHGDQIFCIQYQKQA